MDKPKEASPFSYRAALRPIRRKLGRIPRRFRDWDLFNDAAEIQRDDDSPVFCTDDDAIAWVVLVATDAYTRDELPPALVRECQEALITIVTGWGETDE